MLVFEERKTSRSRVENQKTQPTYDAGSGNRTRDTLVEDQLRQPCSLKDKPGTTSTPPFVYGSPPLPSPPLPSPPPPFFTVLVLLYSSARMGGPVKTSENKRKTKLANDGFTRGHLSISNRFPPQGLTSE